MSQVLVVQPSPRPKDLSSAQRYGTINYIFEDPLFQSGEQPGVAKKRIQDALAQFEPDRDYVLFLGGDPTGAIILGQQLTTMFPGKDVRGLRWERERDIDGRRKPGMGFYVPIVMQG